MSTGRRLRTSHKSKLTINHYLTILAFKHTILAFYSRIMEHNYQNSRGTLWDMTGKIYAKGFENKFVTNFGKSCTQLIMS